MKRCKKRWFATQEEAEEELERMKAIRNGMTTKFEAKDECRAYLCDRCGMYHLTHLTQKQFEKFVRGQ